MKIRLSEKIHLGGSFFVFNLVFSLIALLVLFYLLYLKANDSEGLQCLYKSKLGKECPTCGFTRSFMDYLSFKFDLGYRRNSASLYYFLFACYFSVTRALWVLYCFLFQKKNTSAKIIFWDALILIFQFAVVNFIIFTA